MFFFFIVKSSSFAIESEILQIKAQKLYDFFANIEIIPVRKFFVV